MFKKIRNFAALALLVVLPLIAFADKGPYYEVLLLNLTFRTQTATKPAAIAIILCTNVGTDATPCTEVTNANSYARVTVTQLDANWTAPSGDPSSIGNVNAITFPTATGSWGTLMGFEVRDSATHGAGNRLYWGSLTSNPAITTGMTPSFAAGQLTFSED
jgi:hypothetical protein